MAVVTAVALVAFELALPSGGPHVTKLGGNYTRWSSYAGTQLLACDVSDANTSVIQQLRDGFGALCNDDAPSNPDPHLTQTHRPRRRHRHHDVTSDCHAGGRLLAQPCKRCPRSQGPPPRHTLNCNSGISQHASSIDACKYRP